MKLLDDLKAVVDLTESALGIRLVDADFSDGREEVAHVFLHETCHAAVTRCVPWIHDLSEAEHTALDEILARLLEAELGSSLGLQVHTVEQHYRELSMYGIQISPAQYRRLQEEWRQVYWPSRDIAAMATFALEQLRRADRP